MDIDGDGISSCEGDCADTNPNVSIGTDQDGDGYSGCLVDCDDANLLISPTGEELINDGIDQDCDGEDLTQLVVVGSENICGVNKENVFLCWGSSNTMLDTYPDISVQKMEIGQSESNVFGCALDKNGSVQCWGDNSYDIQNVPIGSFEQLSVGMRTTCAINGWAKLTVGVTTLAFKHIPPVGKYRHVDTSDCHACGIKNDGSIYCWETSIQSLPIYIHHQKEKIIPKSVWADIMDVFWTPKEKITCWGLSGEEYDESVKIHQKGVLWLWKRVHVTKLCFDCRGKCCMLGAK